MHARTISAAWHVHARTFAVCTCTYVQGLLCMHIFRRRAALAPIAPWGRRRSRPAPTRCVLLASVKSDGTGRATTPREGLARALDVNCWAWQVCGQNLYRQGECTPTYDGYTCHACSNLICPSGEFRSGACAGRLQTVCKQRTYGAPYRSPMLGSFPGLVLSTAVHLSGLPTRRSDAHRLVIASPKI